MIQMQAVLLQKTEIKMIKRNPLIATLLSTILPGTGQLYNRQPNKTIWFYSASLLLPIVFVTLGWQYHFWGFATFTFLLFTLYLLNIGDAFFAAVKIKSQPAKPMQKWPLMLLLIFLWTNVYAIAKDSDVAGVRAFVITGNSDAPTMEVGDFIIVGTKHFKTANPQRGELIMFRHSRYPFLTKRVIAVGSDLIEGKDQKVYVNGKLIDEPYAHYSGRKESLDDFGPITVPENQFFVMGDNRDNSFDSRDPEFGFVARETIKGKPLYIYWARNKARIGKKIK
jgi:signal peptidase I